MLPTVDIIITLLGDAGDRQYGGEAVSQLEHALQAAVLAEGDGADEALVAAALLHDIGHLAARVGEERDDRHEQIGAGLLQNLFSRAITEPIRLHVAAKRYLCAVEPGYLDSLSPASMRSLTLQGGCFSDVEGARFGAQPFAQDAVRLRRWDDLAKVPGAATRPLSDYERLLRALAL